MRRRALLTVVADTLTTGLSAFADELIRISLIAPFSGPFTDYDKQTEDGIEAYQRLHGMTAGGRQVQVVAKDTTGPVSDVTKHLAQGLVVRGRVDSLAGFGLTLEALAVVPTTRQAKKLMAISNATSSPITTKSDYVTRVSMTLPQTPTLITLWALKSDIRQVATVVADYTPGIDAESAFRQTFTVGGGQVVGVARVPLRNPELAPFIQYVKDAKP